MEHQEGQALRMCPDVLSNTMLIAQCRQVFLLESLIKCGHAE